MEKGRLHKEGESIAVEDTKKDDMFAQVNETVFDALGNEIKVEKKAQLSDKEKKREIKSLQKKLKDGKKKGILTENEMFEIEDKINELQSITLYIIFYICYYI